MRSITLSFKALNSNSGLQTLFETEDSTLRNALTVAASRFTEDAAALRIDAQRIRQKAQSPPTGPGFIDITPRAQALERMAAQFERQAEQTQALIVALEGKTIIVADQVEFEYDV